jgi:hypothetical protein
MDDVIIFQKLTSQELVILSALDHLKDANANEEVANEGEAAQLNKEDSNEIDDDSDANEIEDDDNI